MTNPPQSKEYPELPEPDGYAGRDYYHRPATMMIAPDPANSRYTADHMRAYADATVAVRAGAEVAEAAKRVPYEPTSDMLIAARALDFALPIEVIRAIWWAMWRTSPKPPAAPRAQKFQAGDLVRKTSGSEWEGRIVGTYSTALTPEGYAVESSAHAGSVQIYPAKALEHIKAPRAAIDAAKGEPS